MESAEPIAVTLGDGEARGSVRIEWDGERLGALDRDGSESGAGWRLDGEIDWTRTATLRVVSAAFDDGSVLALAALRPAESPGHDAETVRAVLVEPEGAGPVELERALISTEYDPAGDVARIGLELYADAEEPPLRASAERREAAGASGGKAGHRSTPLSFRMDGKRGSGLLDILTG
jgi:hypothetical protein